MKLIVGLGNVGSEYVGTRHNIGFEISELLAERAGVTLSEKRFKGRLGRGRLGGESVVIIQPATYMNLSGESVGPAAGYYEIPTEDVIVIHDDLDLDLGRIKLKRGGGHGGHNGLRSLITHLPDAEFIRVRVGIGRPPPEWDSADYVLSRFTDEQRQDADAVVRRAADAVEAIVEGGVGRAMVVFNRSPQRSEDGTDEKGESPSKSAVKEEADGHDA